MSDVFTRRDAERADRETLYREWIKKSDESAQLKRELRVCREDLRRLERRADWNEFFYILALVTVGILGVFSILGAGATGVLVALRIFGVV